jgi:pyruvate formate lyase activating enzyme
VGLDRLGLIKTTLLDYPGRVAAVLFTHGCDLRCPWCHNPGLVHGPVPADFWPRREVLDFLRKRKGVLGGVAVTGGEPLYHQDLPLLLEEIRALGLDLKLDTNGTYPQRLADLELGLVDFVAMDVKGAPSRYDLQGIPGMGPRIVESVRLVQDRYPRRQFRTTWVPGLNVLEEVPEMAALLGPGEELTLTGFRAGVTLDPKWATRRSATAEELAQVAGAFRRHGIAASVAPSG